MRPQFAQNNVSNATLITHDLFRILVRLTYIPGHMSSHTAKKQAVKPTQTGNDTVNWLDIILPTEFEM